MTNADFARKYKDRWLDYNCNGSTRRGKIVGYRGTDLIVIEPSKTSPYGDTWQSIVSYGGYFLSLPNGYIKYHVVNQQHFIVPKDDEITARMPALPKKDEASITHYPHSCPRCGKPSYNAMYGGWVDCSSYICDNYAKER